MWVISSTVQPCSTMIFDALEADQVALTVHRPAPELSTLTVARAAPGMGIWVMAVRVVPYHSSPWVTVTMAVFVDADRTWVVTRKCQSRVTAPEAVVSAELTPR